MTENSASRALERPAAHAEAVFTDVQAIAGGAVTMDAALLDTVLRAWSPNTVRAFRSDLRLWRDWCLSRGMRTGTASSSDVTAWIRALAGIDPSDLKVRAMATIERYLVNVGWAYRMASLPDPTAAPLVRLETKAARKKLSTRQRQARAIRFNRLRKKGWQSRPLASLSPFSSPRRQSFWEVTFQNPVVFDRPRAL